MRLLAGAGLLALVLAAAHPGEALAALRRAAPLPLATAAVWFALLVVLDAARLQLVFAQPGERGSAGRLGAGEALRLTLVGIFFGNFTPGTVGADLYKLVALRGRQGLARPLALTTLLRLIGLAALVGPALLVLLFAPGRFAGALAPPRWSPGALALAAAGLALLAAGAWAALRRTTRGRRLLEDLTAALIALRPAQLAGIALVCLVVTAVRALCLERLAASVGGAVTLPEGVVLAALTVAAGALPLGLGGLGLTEGALAAGLLLLGLGRPEAVAVALLNRAFLWGTAAVGGLILAVGRREKGGSTPPRLPDRDNAAAGTTPAPPTAATDDFRTTCSALPEECDAPGRPGQS